jgi:thermostable 8-oxoguanine DNA glycosylase
MIDPTKITNFNRTEAELQEFLLFCIVVAGKNSNQQAKKLDAFLDNSFTPKYAGGMFRPRPFQQIQLMGGVAVCKRLMAVKMGQYKRITEAFWSVSKLNNLKTVSVEELQQIKGIGPKTARFFLTHSRPNQQFAVLDTHVLKWLRNKGYNTPKSTPSKKMYALLEQIFLYECVKHDKSPAELDLEIWKEMSGRA